MTQFAELMRSWFESVMGAAAGTAAAARPDAPAPGVVVDPLQMPAVRPGERAVGEFWIHNRGGTDVEGVAVHCGDLRTHSGWAIPADRLHFDPPVMDHLPDRSSRGVSVAIDVDADTPEGIYRGTILAANLPSVWLSVELTVLPPQ